ncbi:DUF6044 family protein [Fictibacillus gelatini]|uniref:DUF6044 family protein n=1 Tax=Fictibacillus gelatini TaxID=225985 RepID=UPI000684894F|nr:DUF6044 family protein [Fictibacillus gelatini]
MKSLRTKWNSESRALFFALVLITIYLLPLYVLGENAHIRVHDNLDSNIGWYKVLADSGKLFGSIDAVIPQIINGLPRNSFGTEFSLLVWLHALFPSMVAYAISQTIVRFIAFVGMYVLLKHHFIKEKNAYPITIGVALAFALTPFWPSGMLSTLGHPLALWAFLNIRKGISTWKEWLTLTLLPLYSSFVLGFFFFLVLIGGLWLVDVARKRKWNGVFLGSIAYMTLLYLIIEYRLVASLLVHSEPTSRDEFISSRLGLYHCIRLAFKNFTFGHNHVATVHTFVILPIILLTLLLIVKNKKWYSERQFLLLLILNFALSTWYAFWFFIGWQPLKEKINLLNTFNFARFHFLRPLIIYVSFAIALSFLWRIGKKWRTLVSFCLILQTLILFTCNEEILYRATHKPSFKQFYATHLFNNIKDYIGKPPESYRVASIGLHPVIAQYNGFYTLDTYNNFYPLTYKHQFRTIIAKELDKSKQLTKYFDTWGGRCYIFVSELGKRYMFRKNSNAKIEHLQLNTKAFQEMGGKYIFSAVPILNAKENHLHLLKTFQDSEAAWKIYLYEVDFKEKEETLSRVSLNQ